MGTKPYTDLAEDYITFEEYLVRESESEYRSEYHDGKILAMSGGTSKQPSLKEYVLVYQDEPRIESWYKVEEDVWKITNVRGLDKTLPLYSIDCEILLADIYYLHEDFSTTADE